MEIKPAGNRPGVLYETTSFVSREYIIRKAVSSVQKELSELLGSKTALTSIQGLGSSNIGSAFKPLGMALAAVGGLLGFIKAGKHQDQIQRDNVRQVLQENGALDQNWSIGLADGSRYNIGVDGKAQAEFGNLRAFELDFSKKNVSQTVGLVNPFMAVLSGGNKKIQSDFTGYFVRAAMSNAGEDMSKIKENVSAIFNQIGMSAEQLVGGLVELARQGKITQSELSAYLNGAKTLFSG